MHQMCLVSVVTFTIVTLLGALHSSPIKPEPSNESAFERNFAAPAAPVSAPAPEAPGDARNRAPPRTFTREDTHIRPKPSASVSPFTSQTSSNIQRPSQQNAFNPAIMSSSWANPHPPAPPSTIQRDSAHRQNSNENHPDRLVEGSGAGPPSSNKNHKANLDDTEDSDDDADDEDYDYKDEGGSGQNVHHVTITTTQKPAPSSPQVGETIKKPVYNDFYKPFRPAVTVPPTTVGSANHVYSQTRPTTSSTTAAPQTTTILPSETQLSASRKPANKVTHIAAAPNHKLPPSFENNTETDYDYEDESGEDEMEEVTMFEDNESSDSDNSSANKSHTLSSPSNQAINNLANATRLDTQPPTTSNTNHSQINPQVHSSFSQASLHKQEASRPFQQAPQPFRHPAVIQDSTVTSTTSGNLGAEGDNEDEDDEEEVEDVEEDEDEDEDEDPNMDDSSSEQDGLPEFKVPLVSRPVVNVSKTTTNQNSQSRPVTSSPVPSATQPARTQEHAIPPARAPASHGNQAPNKHHLIVSSIQQMITPASTSVSQVSPLLTETTIATAIPRGPSVMMTTASSPPKQTFEVVTPSKAPAILITTTPAATSAATPYAPSYFPTTIRPHLVATNYLAPTVTTDIQPGSTKGMSYDDGSLTRQIYDKAVEAYYEADKIARAAVDAVWPINFNLDSSSIEPLLAQPIFFMCKYSIRCDPSGARV